MPFAPAGEKGDRSGGRSIQSGQVAGRVLGIVAGFVAAPFRGARVGVFCAQAKACGYKNPHPVILIGGEDSGCSRTLQGAQKAFAG